MYIEENIERKLHCLIYQYLKLTEVFDPLTKNIISKAYTKQKLK